MVLKLKVKPSSKAYGVHVHLTKNVLNKDTEEHFLPDSHQDNDQGRPACSVGPEPFASAPSSDDQSKLEKKPV